MPLTTSDVQQILKTAILGANLSNGNADLAESISKTLADSITPALNGVIGTQTGLISTVQAVSPVMSIIEALTVRDAIRRTIAAEVTDDVQALDAAESLLIADFIDVTKILAAARTDSLEIPALMGGVSTSTGSHAASVDPGTIPTAAS